MKTEIKILNLSEIKLNPNNPRFIRDEKYKALVKSLKDFPEMLELREIVVDETMTILGGNMRYRALKELGEKTALVKIVTGLSEEQKKEFIVKDNLEYGAWDYDILSTEYDLPVLEDWGLTLPEDYGSGDEPTDFNPDLLYGNDTRAKYLIVAFDNEGEKKILCAALGINGNKIGYTFKELKIVS